MDNTDAPAARFTAHGISSSERGGRVYFRGATANSSVSQADAEKRAHELARQRAESAAQNRGQPRGDGTYPYPERVLVEPILERISVAASPGDPGLVEIARITRNGYDASVLNAYRVMFVDVDTVDDTSNAPNEKVVLQDAALSALTALCAERPELGFRIYATRAGLRYLCTSHLFDPVSQESQDILRRLKADPRYATLCRVQKCYRARLSPKPWRCIGEAKPAGFFARLFSNSMRSVGNPENFATCRFLERIGAESTLPAAAKVVAIHDPAVGAFAERPLA